MWAARSRGLIRRMTGAWSSASAAPRRPTPSTGRCTRPRLPVTNGIGRRRRARLAARPRRRSVRGRPASPHGADGARGGQDAYERARRSARGGRSSSLLCRRSAPGICFSARAQGSDRRAERALAARARRVRLHLALELPARHFHRPDRRRARRRQCRGGEAGRADPAHRRPRGEAHASRPAFRQTCCTSFRDNGEIVGAGSGRRSRASTASRSPAAPTPASPSTARSLLRDGPIVKLIAETGGQNAMIVDSSRLPEQVVDDALASAFDSAGQRCSALRVLFLQDDVAGSRSLTCCLARRASSRSAIRSTMPPMSAR